MAVMITDAVAPPGAVEPPATAEARTSDACRAACLALRMSACDVACSTEADAATAAAPLAASAMARRHSCSLLSLPASASPAPAAAAAAAAGAGAGAGEGDEPAPPWGAPPDAVSRAFPARCGLRASCCWPVTLLTPTRNALTSSSRPSTAPLSATAFDPHASAQPRIAPSGTVSASVATASPAVPGSMARETGIFSRRDQ
mmetsp:Transcript_25099/g.94872  ORF Transcript_25099/g.94872 Transcript_25099/m.94872 type:complete len:201 (+) Transcript_25099:4591-5193(+)